jgi:hypothetical protein
MEENATSPTVVTVEENRMKKHVNIAAILQIVFGSILVLGALTIAVLHSDSLTSLLMILQPLRSSE